ncbi:histone-fold-containing protein [Mycena sp. CBHHK59/15]|nr:histone-fold-containing protein [Mycena sp. CBHHK59/15]
MVGGKMITLYMMRRRRERMLRLSKLGINTPSICRLARRGGVKRSSHLIYDDIRSALKIFLESVIKDTALYTEHGYRTTVTSLDIVYALKRSGRTLYGFGL